MSTQYLIVFLIFAIAFVLFQDSNIIEYVELKIKLAQVHIMRYFLLMKIRRDIRKLRMDMIRDKKEWLKEQKKNKIENLLDK